MICYPWTVNWKAQGQDIEEFNVLQALVRRSGCAAGRAARHGGRGRPVRDQSKLPQEERDRRAKILYNQRARPVPA